MKHFERIKRNKTCLIIIIITGGSKVFLGIVREENLLNCGPTLVKWVTTECTFLHNYHFLCKYLKRLIGEDSASQINTVYYNYLLLSLHARCELCMHAHTHILQSLSRRPRPHSVNTHRLELWRALVSVLGDEVLIHSYVRLTAYLVTWLAVRHALDDPALESRVAWHWKQNTRRT